MAFSAARTYHQLATNIESVGFEIRDQIMWLYSSGFPKAQDIGKAIQKRQGVEKYHTEKGTNAYPHTTKNQKMVVGSVTADDYKKEKTHPIPTSSEAQQWSGWKTALKPAHEPICMARKPFKGSTMDNVLTHGVGALNIDATRIPSTPERIAEVRKINAEGGLVAGDGIQKYSTIGGPNQSLDKRSKLAESRYPSNVLGEVEGYQKFFYCPKVSRKERHRGFESTAVISTEQMVSEMGGKITANNMVWTPDLGEFYIHGLKHEYEQWCKKNNKSPLSHIPTNPDGMYAKDENGEYKVKGRNYMYIAEQQRTKKDPLAHIPADSTGKRYYGEIEQRKAVGNNHPTVKPVALMKYLVKLVTAEGAHIIDPFSGSGSTGMAAVELGHTFVGCELDPHYVDIAAKRIEGWLQQEPTTTFNNLFESV